MWTPVLVVVLKWHNTGPQPPPPPPPRAHTHTHTHTNTHTQRAHTHLVEQAEHVVLVHEV
jgi:hypothetical protein